MVNSTLPEAREYRTLISVCCLLMLLLLPIGFSERSFAAAGITIPTYDRVRVLTKARPIRDFELTNQNGEPFRLSELHGQVILIFFGFTNCPDVCPVAMQKFRQLEQSSGEELGDVAFVLISVDGDRDTPDVLKAYLKPFSARFIGLTGKPPDVKAIAKQFSAAFFKENATGADGNYDVSHSPQVFVLDVNGHLRAEFYNASVDAMSGVASALLKETPVRADSSED